MRSDCMSCHGYEGRLGIRTTHPWRNSCQQCHAPSAAMEQTLLTAEPHFLPGPKIKK
jgi:cytochrome c-type protein NapB